jgi:streptogramin lyase
MLDRLGGSWIVDGPGGAVWFTNAANSSMGNITPAAVVTNYTGAGSEYPSISSPAPTALCGSRISKAMPLGE